MIHAIQLHVIYCPPVCKCISKDHSSSMQFYSVTVMTHVKALAKTIYGEDGTASVVL